MASSNYSLKTLVVGESTMWTRPCLGRGTCSGGPRGPPGGVLRVGTCSSTLKLRVPRQFHPRRDEFRTMRAACGRTSATLIAGKPRLHMLGELSIICTLRDAKREGK
eukprot:scaffold88006_cov71-Phaeocystis_antarctica.AAC.1